MELHVVVGAGPIGTATAQELTLMGHRVRILTRRGTGPDHAEIERIAADANDAARLTELAKGATAIYNCANPPYGRWPELWPPMARAILAAAERTEAVLVTMSNLYGYGPVDQPMTEGMPLATKTVKGRVRVAMWQEALAAHRAGRVRVTEARASDFLGVDAKSIFTEAILPLVREGKPVLAPVRFDVPHSLTFTLDTGRLLAVLGTDERALGRAWHVPTPPAVTLGDAARTFARLVGTPEPRLKTMPAAMLKLGAMFRADAREFVEMSYQFSRPFVLDSSLAQKTFALTPTSTEDALRAML